MIVQYRPITYIKIWLPFQAIFKDSSQKSYPPYLEIADIVNIKQGNPYNNQALFLFMHQTYLLLMSSLYIKIMFTLEYQIMTRE